MGDGCADPIHPTSYKLVQARVYRGGCGRACTLTWTTALMTPIEVVGAPGLRPAACRHVQSHGTGEWSAHARYRPG